MSDLLAKVLKVASGDPPRESPMAQTSLVGTRLAPPTGALQPAVINLQPNVPQQLAVRDPLGITIINNLPAVLTLGTEPTFTQNPVTVPTGATYPWRTGTTVWAMTTVSGSITVHQGIQNYSNPNVVSQPAKATTILPTLTFSNTTTQPNVVVPAGTLSLTVVVEDTTTLATIPKLSVVGATTLFNYMGAPLNPTPPYLRTALQLPNVNIWIVPIDDSVDTAYTIQVTSQIGDTCTVTVYANSSIKDETQFYTGSAGLLAGGITATGTLLTGPARVFTLEAAWGASPATIEVDGVGGAGNPILRSAGSSLTQSVNFPPNTILRAGQTLSAVITTPANANVTFTYP